MSELIEVFNKKNIKIIDISSDDGDLEDVFINITKNQIKIIKIVKQIYGNY